MDFFEISNDMLELAKEEGLDPFEVRWEIIPDSYMLELATYALPNRPSHWSYGRSYDYQKTMGEMGFSHLYEVVFNNDPCYAYCLNSNTEVDNILITAHVYGHSDFFKNNIMYDPTDRNMINRATNNARRFEEMRDLYGNEAVEHTMDLAFAFDGHIDWKKGRHRKRYEPKTSKYIERYVDEFEDLFGDKGPAVIKKVSNESFPPHPEKDILWFFVNYANGIEEWQKDIFSSIREEAYYFYPQRMTKIMNEGWASFWHSELVHKFHNNKKMTDANFIDFCNTTSKVVSMGGGGSINPYYLGYKIWVDIEKRWNKYYKEGFEDENGAKILDKNGNVIKSKIDGRQKIFEVRKYEDDISFIQNYLTKELIQEMGLFRWGFACNCQRGCDKCNTIIITSMDAEKIKEELVRPIVNGGQPIISIEAVGEDGTLYFRHRDADRGMLDLTYAETVLSYAFEIWGRPVSIRSKDANGKIVDLSYGRDGFNVYQDQ